MPHGGSYIYMQLARLCMPVHSIHAISMVGTASCCAVYPWLISFAHIFYIMKSLTYMLFHTLLQSIVYVIDSMLVPEDLDPSAGAATNNSSGSTEAGTGSAAPASPPPALPPPTSGALAAAFGLPVTFGMAAVSALALVAVGVFLT